jgi:hypothetical protein
MWAVQLAGEIANAAGRGHALFAPMFAGVAIALLASIRGLRIDN